MASFSMHRIPELFIAHEHRIQNRGIIKFKVVLFQHGQAQSGTDFDISLGGFNFTGKDLEKSGFPGTVGADHPITIPLGKGNIHFIKQNPFPKQQGDIIRADHAVIFEWAKVRIGTLISRGS